MPDSQRFLNDISSWYWWLSVVVIGLAINLASAYLKGPLDKFLSQWNSKRKAQFSEREKSRHLHAQKLAANPGLLALEIRNESISILGAISFLVIAAVFVSFAAWIHSAIPTSDKPLRFVTGLLAAVALALVVVAMRIFSRAFLHSERIAYVRRYLRKSTEV